MSSESNCPPQSYQCAHCKLINHGEPAEIVIIDDQELYMCCIGCVYVADMLNHACLPSETS